MNYDHTLCRQKYLDHHTYELNMHLYNSDVMTTMYNWERLEDLSYPTESGQALWSWTDVLCSWLYAIWVSNRRVAFPLLWDSQNPLLLRDFIHGKQVVLLQRSALGGHILNYDYCGIWEMDDISGTDLLGHFAAKGSCSRYSLRWADDVLISVNKCYCFLSRPRCPNTFANIVCVYTYEFFFRWKSCWASAFVSLRILLGVFA